MPNQTHQAWLDARRLGIGGSDAAAVLSEGYGCPRALFLDKTGVEPDYQHTEAELALFDRGHIFEPLVVQRFSEDTGLTIRRMPTRISADRPWMRVNIDRMIHTIPEGHEWYGKFEGPGYLEAKTANEEVYQNMREEGMPNHYVIQGQHGLAVTGWKWGVYAVRALPSWRKLYVPFVRNENMIEVLKGVEYGFWEQVKRGLIPAKLADFNDQRCEKCVYRRGCRNAEALPAKPKMKPNYVADEHPDLVRLVGGLKETEALIEELEITRGSLREGIKAHLGDRTHVHVESQGIKLNLSTQSGSLRWDSKALDADHPELAARYKRRGEPFQVLRVYDATEVEGKREAMQEVA